MKIETPRLTLRDFTPGGRPSPPRHLRGWGGDGFQRAALHPAQTQAFWSSSALPAGEAWPAWRKPPA